MKLIKRNRQRTLNEKLLYLERAIVRCKNKPLKKRFLIWKYKKLEQKWERDWLKKR